MALAHANPERSVPKQWLHGFLEPCVLWLLATERDYGYGLSQRLAEAGLGDVPGGTLYPALLRLETQGYLTVSWEHSTAGPRRKYYTITPAGRVAAKERELRWGAFRDSIERVTATRRPTVLPANRAQA